MIGSGGSGGAKIRDAPDILGCMHPDGPRLPLNLTSHLEASRFLLRRHFNDQYSRGI